MISVKRDMAVDIASLTSKTWERTDNISTDVSMFIISQLTSSIEMERLDDTKEDVIQQLRNE